jgi:hypothetical protein
VLTIIYYTDNTLPEDLETTVQRQLVLSAEGKPIISVSQKPLAFGRNICLGDIGRSHLSIYRQMLAGGEAADTEWVGLAEHDCMYTPEHWNFMPPDKGVFWYNINHYFVNSTTGEYSYYRRRVLSMLICAKDIFLRAVREKVWMLGQGHMIRKGVAGAMEPGCLPDSEAFVKIACEPGVCDDRRDYLDALAQFKDLGKELGRWKAEAFATTLPNLDIRHGGNFSGARRGTRRRCFELPYWGKWKSLSPGNAVSMEVCA